jgi:polyhydroxybutyrate depolymerase
MRAVKKVFVALSAILVWTAIPAVSANAVSIGQTCAKTTLGTRVSIRVSKKSVIVVCRNVAGRKKWIRAAVQTLATTTTSTSTTSTTAPVSIPEPVINFTDAVDSVDPTLHIITVEGMRPRKYYLNVPSTYTPGTASPLIIGFHGIGGSASEFRVTSKIDVYAEERGMISVFPEGYGPEYGIEASWNAGLCCGLANLNELDDVALMSAIIDSIETKYMIDKSRVWAVGFSNGGMFSYRLACELSDKITAIGVGAGSLMSKTCNTTKAVSIIHLHGESDADIPFNGSGFYNSRDVVSNITTVNAQFGCTDVSGSLSKIIGQTEWKWNCSKGTDMQIIKYDGQGHKWTFEWTKVVIKFLFAHPRQ